MNIKYILENAIRNTALAAGIGGWGTMAAMTKKRERDKRKLQEKSEADNISQSQAVQASKNRVINSESDKNDSITPSVVGSAYNGAKKILKMTTDN